MTKAKKQIDKRKRSAGSQGSDRRGVERPADDVALFDVTFNPMWVEGFSYQIHFFKCASNKDGHLVRLAFFAGYDGRDDYKVWRWRKLGEYNPHGEGLDVFIKSDGVMPLPWTGDECEDYTIEAMRSMVAAFRERWGAFWDWTNKKEKTPLDCEYCAELLNPYGGGLSMTGNARSAISFILAMIEYPRYLEDIFLRVGGELFGDSPGIFPGVGAIFEETFAHFKECIAWYGRRFGCRGKAEKVLGCAGMVYNWICRCETIDAEAFAILDKWFCGVRDALYEMAIAVADAYIPNDGARCKSRFAGQTVKGAGEYKGKCARVNLSGNGVILKDGTVCAFPPSCIFALDLLLDGFRSGKDRGYVRIDKRRWASNIKQKETLEIIEQEQDSKGCFTGRARFKPSAF